MGEFGHVGRRTFLSQGAAAAAGACLAARAGLSQVRARPRPTSAQLAWQREEIALFIHFGINTFTDREWGDGREDPAGFRPSRLDPRQWARAARAGGARALVLTAKHHDGFCLWPTRTTRHSVVSSPWAGGAGDLVRLFAAACRAEGLGVGLYLSPWDRNHAAYGDSDRYNDVYAAQLTELLTGYGALSEVWFDGANGEGPNGRRQVYDWPRVWALVKRLQPQAVVFSDAGPDVRWSGNEAGTAGEPNWSTVDSTRVPAPGASDPDIIAALQHGDPHGDAWRPAEADTSIRPGWFYHPAEDGRVKSVDRLVDLYCQSVGRNAKLLLNVPPTPAGLLHETDVAHFVEAAARRRALFGEDVLRGRRVVWRRHGSARASAEVDLGRARPIAAVRLAEPIARGQSVARYRVLGRLDGPWRELASGATIGYARIDRFAAAEVRHVRVAIDEAVAPPDPLTVQAFA
jgi:alpha-L-fucosidase